MSQNLHSIVAEPLVRTTIDTLPPAPALLALARFRYAPKAKFGPAAGPGPVAFVVESGSLQFSAQGRVSVRRRNSGSPEYPPHDREFTVRPGDEVLIPGNVVHAVYNPGSSPATILGAATFPGGGPPRNFPDGVTFVPLVISTVTTLAPAPAEYALDRVTLAPGSREADAYYAGPGLHYVETGALDLQVVTGELQIIADLASGQVETVRAGREAQVATAHGVMVPAGSVATIGNTGSQSAVVLSLRTRAAFAPTQIDIKQILPSFVHTVIDGANPGAVGQFLGAGFFSHDQPAAAAGRKDIDVAAFLEKVIFPAFSHFETQFPTLISDGELVASHWVQSFQHSGDGYFGIKATGKSVTIDGFTIARVQDGKLVEHWEQRDIPSWHRQIGLGFPLGPLERGVSSVTAEQEKTVARNYYAAWNAGDRTRLEEVMSSDALNHSLLPGQLPGRAGMVQLMSVLRDALDGYQVTVDLVVGDGSGSVFGRVRFSGTHRAVLFGVPATGRPVEFAAIDLLTVSGGQIVARAGQLDLTSLAVQLGVLSPPSAQPPRS